MPRPRLAIAILLLGLTLSGSRAMADDAAAEASGFSDGLARAAENYAAGDALAAAEVGDLFYRFEESEFHKLLAAKDPELYKRLEGEWLGVRRLMKGGAPATDVSARVAAAREAIQQGRALTGVDDGWALFWGSFLIIFREGFEALLIIGALAAYLRKTGNQPRVRDLYAGAGAAVAASLLLWMLTKTILSISGAQAEAIEGWTLLLASAVLFYVSYWLISKVQHAKWQAFVQRQVASAVQRGGRAAMLGVSFLVVFREGLETVLFYEALAASAGGAAGLPTLLAGLLSGVVVLAGVYGGIHFLGMRLRIGTFFAVTSALLYWMAFKFAGDGVRELQEAGTVGETVLRAIPESPFLQSWLGVHPFAETIAAQAILLIALAIGLGITLRRARQGIGSDTASDREETRRSVA